MMRRHPLITAAVAAVLFVLAIPLYWVAATWYQPACQEMNHHPFPECYKHSEHDGPIARARAKSAEWPFYGVATNVTKAITPVI